MAINLISTKETHKYIFPKGDFSKPPIEGEVLANGSYINMIYNTTNNGIDYYEDNPEVNGDVFAYLKSDFRELTSQEIKDKYYTTSTSVTLNGYLSFVGMSAIPVAATYFISKDNKIENSAIAAGIVGGFGIGLINSKGKGGYAIGWDRDPFYAGIGNGILLGSIGYKVSKDYFKLSVKNAFLVSGILLAASIYYFNPKLALPIDRAEELMKLNNE
jgi:hypothetical protein